jgi:hypothetical protein
MRSARLRIAVAFVLAALAAAVPLHAQDFRAIAYNTFTTDVTLTTTSETVIVSSGSAPAPRDSLAVVIIAWAQLTTGTNTTAVTPRIRRGTTTGGTLVGEANAEQVKAAAGSTEPMFIMVQEDRTSVASVDYSLTLQQTAASANGSALAGGILVLAR